MIKNRPYLLILILLSVVAVSCRFVDLNFGDIDREYALDKTGLIWPEKFKIEPSIEPLGIRSDLKRARMFAGHRNRDSRTLGSDSSGRYIRYDYHYIGLSLGNSLYLDANNNLSINVLDYFNIDLKKQEVRVYDWLEGESYVISEVNDSIIRREVEEESPDMIVSKHHDTTHVYVDKFSDIECDIFMTDDRIVCEGSGMGDELIKEKDNHYINELFIDNRDYQLISPDTLIIDQYYLVRNGRMIEIFETSADKDFSDKYEVDNYLVLKEDGFVCYTSVYKGVMARRRGDTITVEQNDNYIFDIIVNDK